MKFITPRRFTAQPAVVPYTFIFGSRKNGADEPQTSGRVSVNSNNGDTLPIVPYIIQLNAGDYVEFAARASDTDCQILAVNAASVPFGPAIPSLIVGIKRIG